MHIRAGEPVTVVHLITTLETGGAEAILSRLVVNMDRSRFRPVVVSMLSGGALAQAIEDAGVKVHTLGMKRGVPDVRALLRLVSILRQEKPEILQTWLYHADLLGSVGALAAGVPCLLWNLRCSDLDLSEYSTMTKVVLHVLARLSRVPDGVVFNAEAGRKVHAAYGYRPRRWEFIPNGFDLDRFRPDPEAGSRLRSELGLPVGSYLIGLPARYDPMKGHATFIQAAAILAERRTDAFFVMVGRGVDGSNRELATMLGEHGLASRVRLLGERHDMHRLIPAFDLVTLSSAFGEGFPNVLGEAMSCGVPCVATDVGDSAAVLGETGAVVPPRDPHALAQAWERVLGTSSPTRAAIGIAARQRVADLFSLPAVVRRYERLYEECIGKIEVT